MNKLRLFYKSSHFTMVELLVVISIITILASLLLPALKNAMATSRKIACASNMRQLGLAIANYANDYAEFMPMAANDVTKITWDGVIRGYLGPELSLSQMMAGQAPRYWSSNKLFACPADKIPRYSDTYPDENKRSYTANVCYWGGSQEQHGPMGTDISSYIHPWWVKITMIQDFSGTFLLMEKPTSWISLGAYSDAGQNTVNGLMTAPNEKLEGFHGSYRYNFLHVDGHVTNQNPYKTIGRSGSIYNPYGSWTREKGD